MTRSILAVVCLTGACAGTFGVPDDRSWFEQMKAANRHEQLAAVHAYDPNDAAVGAGFNCGDQVLEDQSRSGGLPVTTFQPCLDIQEEMRASQRDTQKREEAIAQRERHAAAVMARGEALACEMVPPAERAHSAFAHSDEISAVIPHREGGALHGARIVFRPVPGLDAERMRRAIACRRAQWVVFGRDPKLDPDDPTLLDGVDVTVNEVDGHVEVLVTSETPADAQLALMRANRQGALAVR